MKKGHQPKKTQVVGAPPKSGSSVANPTNGGQKDDMRHYAQFLKENLTIRIEKEQEMYSDNVKLRVSLYLGDEVIDSDNVYITD